MPAFISIILQSVGSKIAQEFQMRGPQSGWGARCRPYRSSQPRVARRVAAYRSEEMQAKLHAKKLKSHIHRKGKRGKPLTEQAKGSNRTNLSGQLCVDDGSGADRWLRLDDTVMKTDHDRPVRSSGINVVTHDPAGIGSSPIDGGLPRDAVLILNGTVAHLVTTQAI